MRDHSGNVGYGNEDFFITTSSATPSSTLAPGATTAFVTPSSTAPPPGRSMVQPTTTTAIQPPPIATSPAALPVPGGNSALSGGAIAGIAIGSISGVLALVGLIAWRKVIWRRTSNSEALLSGFAPTKDSFWKKLRANEPASSIIERGEGVVHEMSAADPVTVFELESPRHEGPYEMAEK